MKKYLHGNEVKVIKELGIKEVDKNKKTSTWVQIEYEEGKQKGCRVPCILEELKEK